MILNDKITEAFELSKNEDAKFHPGWLRIMYAYTIVGAGGIGLALLVAPTIAMPLLGFPAEEPIVTGVAYSMWVSFGILSVLGLRSPLKYVPVLLLQFGYKVVWFLAVFAPVALSGSLPLFALPMAALFSTMIIGDIFAIPWRYFLTET